MSAEGSSTAASLSRRGFLTVGASAAVSVAGLAAEADAATEMSYPRLRIAALANLPKNQAVKFNYPLAAQPNVLIDFDRPVPQGVGPQSSIVAYSTLCQHMGCPVGYHSDQRVFSCPCHQTRYDAERLGSIIQGIALLPLPRVLLQVQGGVVWAVGMDGLVYGYRNNLTPGKRVAK
jgi:arsenite oxidase small subunit